jgi:glycosyl transferase, family 25
VLNKAKRKKKRTNKEKTLFKKLNNYFDHIYLITLKRSTDRQELIHDCLEGLDYEVFWGVDGESLNLSHLKNINRYSAELAKKKSSSNIPLTRGEIGCALSHVNIYKDMLSKNYDRVLILEDDLKVNIHAAESISKAFNELPDDWEFLYLGYLEEADGITLRARVMINFVIPLVNLFKKKWYDPERLRRKFYRPYSENLEISGKHSGTHAYGLTIEGAKKILEFQTPVVQASDNAVGEMCLDGSLNAYRLKKQAFYQNRDLPTTIKNRYQ